MVDQGGLGGGGVGWLEEVMPNQIRPWPGRGGGLHKDTFVVALNGGGAVLQTEMMFMQAGRKGCSSFICLGTAEGEVEYISTVPVWHLGENLIEYIKSAFKCCALFHSHTRTWFYIIGLHTLENIDIQHLICDVFVIVINSYPHNLSSEYTTVAL